MPSAFSFRRHGVSHLATGAIDDPVVVRPASQELEQLVVGRRLRHDSVSQVWPIETGDIALRVTQFQLLQDVVPHPLGRSRGQGHDGDVGQNFPQPDQLAIFRPEIVAPLADAMRFVDRDLRDLPFFYLLDKRLEHEPLRRDVEKTKFTVVQSPQARPRLRPVERGVQKRCRDPARLKRVDLILHERDERGNHNRQAVAQESGQLKTKRLSAARRHECKNIASGERVAHDLLLERPEGRVAEVLLEGVWEGDAIHPGEPVSSVSIPP